MPLPSRFSLNEFASLFSLLRSRANVLDFGAVGDGVTDDTSAFLAALATGKDVFAPDGTYLITDTLRVVAQRLYGQNGNKTILRFRHSNGDFAIKVETRQRGGGVDSFFMDAAVDGLKGLNMRGTILAKAEQLYINNFTEIALQLGDTPGWGGMYWSEISKVRIDMSSSKNGVTGLLIDGGSIPGSNANSLNDVVIGGNFQRPLHIKGVGNQIKGGTIELFRGNENVVSMIYIEGSGNKIDGMYVEPVAGPPPATLVEFGPAASGNSVEIWPQYVPTHNVSASIIDNGSHNKVKLRRPGANFKIGPEAEPSHNLLMNSAFRAWRDAENPAGWLFGTVGRISRVAPESAGGPAILRMTLESNHATIQSFVTDYFTATSGALPLDVRYLRGKPVIVGVWCRTSVPGAGGVKFGTGSGSVSFVGGDRHSGSGNWELLLAHGNVGAEHDRVGMELRSHTTNAAITGTVDFRDPFFIIGSDVSFFSPKPLTDTGGKMFGDLEFPLDYVDKGRGGILRLGQSYVWSDTTGRLRIGNTRPTDATWDTAGTVVGTQS
jgi:hypothetical protein